MSLTIHVHFKKDLYIKDKFFSLFTTSLLLHHLSLDIGWEYFQLPLKTNQKPSSSPVKNNFAATLCQENSVSVWPRCNEYSTKKTRTLAGSFKTHTHLDMFLSSAKNLVPVAFKCEIYSPFKGHYSVHKVR